MRRHRRRQGFTKWVPVIVAGVLILAAFLLAPRLLAPPPDTTFSTPEPAAGDGTTPGQASGAGVRASNPVTAVDGAGSEPLTAAPQASVSQVAPQTPGPSAAPRSPAPPVVPQRLEPPAGPRTRSPPAAPQPGGAAAKPQARAGSVHPHAGAHLPSPRAGGRPGGPRAEADGPHDAAPQAGLRGGAWPGEGARRTADASARERAERASQPTPAAPERRDADADDLNIRWNQ